MILVTGATGTTGRELVGILKFMGEDVRAMTHRADKVSSIETSGVDIVQGDYNDLDSLDNAMRGVDRVFLLAPSYTSEHVAWERNITDAAVRARVKRIVKHSVICASSLSPIGFIRQHWESEKYIEASGIPFVFVRPNTFMQNMLMNADSIAKEGRFYGATGDGRISVIDVRDVASVEAIALTEDVHEGRTYEITGTEALNYADVAAKISQAIGRQVVYVDLPPEDYRQEMIKMGMTEQRANDYTIYQQYLREDRSALATPWVYRITGGMPMNFDQFAHDYAAVFSGEAHKAA